MNVCDWREREDGRFLCDRCDPDGKRTQWKKTIRSCRALSPRKPVVMSPEAIQDAVVAEMKGHHAKAGPGVLTLEDLESRVRACFAVPCPKLQFGVCSNFKGCPKDRFKRWFQLLMSPAGCRRAKPG
jgi:hypothetical protein